VSYRDRSCCSRCFWKQERRAATAAAA
jgi:hypothetical protein